MSSLIKKILICDDHPIVHTGIKYTLKELFPHTKLELESVTSGEAALAGMKSKEIDILFLDIGLPDISGVEVLKTMSKEAFHKPRVIVLTAESNLPTLLQISKYKLSAILLKSYTNASFQAAFDHLLSGENFTYLDISLEQTLKSEVDKKQLSSKEFDVLNLLVKGYSNKAIAEILTCSPETVKSHLANIARKTLIDNRDDLISWYYEGREK